MCSVEQLTASLNSLTAAHHSSALECFGDWSTELIGVELKVTNISMCFELQPSTSFERSEAYQSIFRVYGIMLVSSIVERVWQYPGKLVI